MKSLYIDKIVGGIVSLFLVFGLPTALFAEENPLIEAFGEINTTSVEAPIPTLINKPVTDESPQIEALIEQINALLVIVAQLQTQLLQTATDPQNIDNVGFTRNFGIGDEHFEILGLQQFLNSDIRTRVAVKGPGSTSQESTYYGALTANAVSKFQELYKSEILTPAGLSRGTGFFGPGTRKKMNALVIDRAAFTVANTPSNTPVVTEYENPTQNVVAPAVVPPINTESTLINGNSLVNNLTPTLSYEVYDGFSAGVASSYEGAPGESITIEGTQLTNGTNIHFGDVVVTGIANTEETSLTFTIPNVEKGPYELTFTSAAGEKAIRIMDFVVTNQNATTPEIFSISPSFGQSGTQITIHGTGFTTTNNQVEFGQHTVTNVPSSDGKQIIINVTPGIEISTLSIPGAEWPVFVYLANANGRVEKPGIFIIKN